MIGEQGEPCFEGVGGGVGNGVVEQGWCDACFAQESQDPFGRASRGEELVGHHYRALQSELTDHVPDVVDGAPADSQEPWEGDLDTHGAVLSRSEGSRG